MYLMVLDDGETFSALTGCKIVEVPDDIAAYVQELGELVGTPSLRIICELGEANEEPKINVYWRADVTGFTEFWKGQASTTHGREPNV